MIPNNGTCVVLSDSIFAGSSMSKDCPAFLMMNKVNVKVIPFAAPGLPVGRIAGAAYAPIALCDQKIGINALRGFYNQIDCAIIFGGLNDLIHGPGPTVVNNYCLGLMELAIFLAQSEIPEIVIVSPSPQMVYDEDVDYGGVKIADMRTAAEFAVASVSSKFTTPIHYINGYNLMPKIAENFEADNLHPNATGRAILINNLVTELQTLGVFPPDYAV